ncbi:Putative methyltransferase KIAA1 homolog [Babesia bigemina]|uniref:Putative methyltransferase KIAA1 homolog n=1 Tax=Babesia bigemina TaxID=5866 RepID=A0A061D5V5_BABBI|nr:Putative methyltransferase KIAA1 homolog [Babesia bigemina]CDR95397.1 Putative methyltransferase KIAA1 homolog [Babesia bigemina]|eukprot:XP_012767583.1 Putative methyltransferase KIAA1 homolog [Babesia bigemina]
MNDSSKSAASEDDKKCIPIDLTKEDRNTIESQYVHDLYEEIAPHFSHTRYNQWPGVLKYINAAESYSTVLDVGCGNGKYLQFRSDLLFIGVDRCSGLLKLAYDSKCPNVLRCDCLNLPFPSEVADLTLSIAVIHHLPSADQRRSAVTEMLRCTRSGGRLVVYVWAREQQKLTIGYRNFEGGDILVPWHMQKKYIKDRPIDGASTKTTGRATVYRFYHVFTREEVEELGASFNDVANVDSIEFEANNWILTLIKL